MSYAPAPTAAAYPRYLSLDYTKKISFLRKYMALFVIRAKAGYLDCKLSPFMAMSRGTLKCTQGMNVL